METLYFAGDCVAGTSVQQRSSDAPNVRSAEIDGVHCTSHFPCSYRLVARHGACHMTRRASSRIVADTCSSTGCAAHSPVVDPSTSNTYPPLCRHMTSRTVRRMGTHSLIPMYSPVSYVVTHRVVAPMHTSGTRNSSRGTAAHIPNRMAMSISRHTSSTRSAHSVLRISRHMSIRLSRAIPYPVTPHRVTHIRSTTVQDVPLHTRRHAVRLVTMDTVQHAEPYVPRHRAVRVSASMSPHRLRHTA